MKRSHHERLPRVYLQPQSAQSDRVSGTLEAGAYAAGGILSAAPDVAGFVRALFTGIVLATPMVTEMRNCVDALDEDVPAQRGYGLGVRDTVTDGQELLATLAQLPAILPL